MSLLVIGINHQTAPVALREKIAFNQTQLTEALPVVKASGTTEEIAILSTCNRTELYCTVSGQEAATLVDWLCRYHDLPLSELEDALYFHWDEDAVRHLMRVAVGLDSMVLGEPQILGQIKSAFATAQGVGTTGRELNRLFQRTFTIAKKVRTETGIGENPVSVAYAAASLAQQIFSDIRACQALFLGAGETIELVARHLASAGLTKIVIANRTLSRAKDLVQDLGGEAVSLSDIAAQLPLADIVIASTASDLPLLGKGAVESALKQRRHKPIFMVDLAVPRDIEPEVADLQDIYLYSVDDLQQIIEDNLKSREKAAREAEDLIREGVAGYLEDLGSLGAVDTLVRFRRKYEQLKDDELAKAMQRLDNGDDPAAVIKQMANRLTNKIIHTPSIQLKKAGSDGNQDLLTYATALFELDADPEADTQA